MNLIEKRINLFEVEDKYYFAHCISADYALGADIATEFQKRFKLKNKLQQIGSNQCPDCILINKVFNLVTKAKYWHKPIYESLEKSLVIMRDMIIELNKEEMKIQYLATPKIGCGLDRLQWGKVREIIQKVFKDVDIEILVCYL